MSDSPFSGLRSGVTTEDEAVEAQRLVAEDVVLSLVRTSPNTGQGMGVVLNRLETHDVTEVVLSMGHQRGE